MQSLRRPGCVDFRRSVAVNARPRPCSNRRPSVPSSRAHALLSAEQLTIGDLGLPFVSVEELRSPQQGTELGWRDVSRLAQEYSMLPQVAVLGAGSFGTVRLAVHRSSGVRVAIKTMPKIRGRQTRERTLDKIKRETSFLRRLQVCPQVVQLIDRFEDKEEVHLVTELCAGGDLRQVVEGCGPLEEHSLASVAYQALQFIQGCHDNNLLYGDMKPANLCIMQPHKCGSGKPLQLKAIDFGTSQNCTATERLNKWTGTLTFLAPEVYLQNYGHKADMWSLGVTLYWCFSARYPFWASGQPPARARLEEMAEYVMHAPIKYDSDPWLSASPECLDFMRRCLERDEKKRISVQDALQHPWFARFCSQQ